MAITKKQPLFFLLGMILLLPLHSQELRDQGRTFVVQTETGARIMQRLSWPGDENASQYEAVVEVREQNAWRQVYRQVTRNTRIEIALGPGQYRYRVLYYNLLYRVEHTTNWASFSIVPAVAPTINSYNPEGFYLLEDPRTDIIIDGDNIFEETEIYLEPIEEGKERIVPGEIIIQGEGKRVRLVFNKEDVQPGDYRLRLVNPGGLAAVVDPFVIAWGTPFNINVSAAYSPAIPLNGAFADTFDQPAWPGAMIRASYIPLKRPWGYLGGELAVSWNYFTAQETLFDAGTHLINVQADLLYRKPLNRYISLNARAGIGISAFTALTFTYQFFEERTNPVYLSANIGASALWYFRKPFYAELGMDYMGVFSRGFPGFLRPHAGIGWQY
jgi:hypothetical protein